MYELRVSSLCWYQYFGRSTIMKAPVNCLFRDFRKIFLFLRVLDFDYKICSHIYSTKIRDLMLSKVSAKIEIWYDLLLAKSKIF